MRRILIFALYRDDGGIIGEGTIGTVTEERKELKDVGLSSERPAEVKMVLENAFEKLVKRRGR